MIEFIEIKKGKIVENNEKVFDIEVEKDNSFVLENGIVAHNCLTRKQTGVGRPQFSTIVECADAAHQVGVMVFYEDNDWLDIVRVSVVNEKCQKLSLEQKLYLARLGSMRVITLKNKLLRIEKEIEEQLNKKN